MNRTRRLRKTERIRRLVRETKLSVDDFIYPLFIEEGENIETEIVSMPGIKRFSLDRISKELDEVVDLKYSCSFTYLEFHLTKMRKEQKLGMIMELCNKQFVLSKRIIQVYM